MLQAATDANECNEGSKSSTYHYDEETRVEATELCHHRWCRGLRKALESRLLLA